jgi:lysophospholipase L1-like esterase
MPIDLTRRQFAGAAAMSGLAAAATAVAQNSPSASDGKPIIRPGDTILFQGDSITDAGRARGLADPNNPAALGKGYAWLAAAQLLLDRSGDNLKIFNRGVSGNKVFQLADRWQEDCLNLKPNVLSILIGVNDIWHKLNGQYDGTVEKYQTDYAALLKRTRDALPEVRLVICEPFVLRTGAVTDKWFPEFDAYRAAARSVAKEAGATFVPFHEMFEAASQLAPPERWAKDGVHPDPDGAALMAHAWLKAVGA